MAEVFLKILTKQIDNSIDKKKFCLQQYLAVLQQRSTVTEVLQLRSFWLSFWKFVKCSQNFLGIFCNIREQLHLRKDIHQGDYSELSFTQLFCFVTALILYCSQKNRGPITAVASIMECERYIELIYPFHPTRKYAVHYCFLKTVRF